MSRGLVSHAFDPYKLFDNYDRDWRYFPHRITMELRELTSGCTEAKQYAGSGGHSWFVFYQHDMPVVN